MNLEAALLENLRAHLTTRDRRTLEIDGFRRAAVLVALTDAPQPDVVLTERSAHLPTHQGQIAFPGGKLEPFEDAVQAALREAWEEINLEPSAVRVLGMLHDVWTPQGFQVTPVLASIPSSVTLAPRPGEVERILHVPIKDLHALTPRLETRDLPPDGGRWPPGVNGPRDVLHYDWRGIDIWGMTAFVLHELLELTSDLERSR